MQSARIFGTSAIVAVFGVVIGCTSTIQVIEQGDASVDGSTGRPRSPGKGDASAEPDDDSGTSSPDGSRKKDASNEPEEDSGTDANIGPTTCPSNAPFDEGAVELELGPYKGPAPRSTACSPSELTQLDANFKAQLKNWDELVTGVGATCAGCVLTSTDDTHWGPIVTLAADPNSGFINFGACHAALSSVACGRAVQLMQFCLDQACAECSSAAEEQACFAKAAATGGVCNAVVNAVGTSCPNIKASEQACGTSLLQQIKVLCGGP